VSRQATVLRLDEPHALADPRVTLTITDGRNFCSRPGDYDVIRLEPPERTRRLLNLYTREFYELAPIISAGRHLQHLGTVYMTPEGCPRVVRRLPALSPRQHLARTVPLRLDHQRSMTSHEPDLRLILAKLEEPRCVPISVDRYRDRSASCRLRHAEDEVANGRETARS